MMKIFQVALVVACLFAAASAGKVSSRMMKHWASPSREERMKLLPTGSPLWKAMTVSPDRLHSRAINHTTHGTKLQGRWNDIDLWFISLEVGTPSKTYTVQVDTGSSDLGIPDTECGSSCGNPVNGPWDPSQSTSAQKVSCKDKAVVCGGGYGPMCKDGQCAYSIEYEDGSGYSAKIWQDDVVMAGQPIKGAYVGGIFKEEDPSGPFEPRAVDGICGFAWQIDSVVEAPTLTDVLHKNDEDCPNVFSMCGNIDGGAMTICGYGNHHSHPIQWTPMVQVSSGFYNIHTVDLALNGTRLGLESTIYNDGFSTVDSGTTGVYIPDRALKKIFELTQQNYCNNGIEVKGVCNLSFSDSVFGGGCFEMSEAEVAAYPSIEIVAGKDTEITIPMTPQSYIIKGFCNSPTAYSSNIVGNGPSSCLFGDSVMLANQVVYDKDNLRLGFSLKENCNYE